MRLLSEQFQTKLGDMKKEVVRLRENYKDAVLAQLAVAIGGYLQAH